MNSSNTRILSIDAFRALTMFLMIFVNDLDDIPNVPLWLKHVSDNADGLGLADTIFPTFLFIVGLSIPFAFENRIKRGDRKIPVRILTRSLALIVIGFYHANTETYSGATAILPRPVWESLTNCSFLFLLFDYRNISLPKKYFFQGAGLLLLVIMSFLYKSNDPVNSGLHLTWWGILGLIGWSYLVCSLIFYYSKGVPWIQAAVWIFFILFNLDYHFGWFNSLKEVQQHVWIAGDGAMQAFTMSGIFVAVMYKRLNQHKAFKELWIFLILLSAILFNLGFIVRYYSGGISKVRDTPAWVLICTGISLVVYAFFIFIVDYSKKYKWFKIIEPAGTNTFTCYLIPFLFYPIYELSDFEYPDYLSFGTGGLIKCILFSFAMIWLAGLLKKLNIRFKI